jgi:dihydrodipicolinate synthase/N-acetylneuraminate lyase
MKPSFQLVIVTEYMFSTKAIGASGLLSNLANLAPKLLRDLYDVCKQEKFQAAYDLQIDAAILCIAYLMNTVSQVLT